MSLIIHIISSLFLASAYYAESATTNSSTPSSSSSSSAAKTESKTSTSTSSSSTSPTTSSAKTESKSSSSTPPPKSSSSSSSSKSGDDDDDDSDSKPATSSSSSTKESSKSSGSTSGSSSKDASKSSGSSNSSSSKDASKSSGSSNGSSSKDTSKSSGSSNGSSSKDTSKSSGSSNGSSSKDTSKSNSNNNDSSAKNSSKEKSDSKSGSSGKPTQSDKKDSIQPNSSAQQKLNSLEGDFADLDQTYSPSHQAAVLAGFRNAEAGYSPSTDNYYYSGAGYQYDWEQSFYVGVYQHYNRVGVNPLTQSVPTGPMQAMLTENNYVLSDSERQSSLAIDEAYRTGQIIISVPGKTFDGEITQNLSATQQFALDNTVVIIGDGAQLRELGVLPPGADGASSAMFTDSIATAGVTSVADDSFYFTSSNQQEGFESTFQHELEHAANHAINHHAEELLKNPSQLSTEDLILAQEAYNITLAVNQRALVTQVQQANTADGIIPETTLASILEVNPDFVEQDEYYLRLTEMVSYSLTSTVDELATRLEYTSNSQLTKSESQEIARILNESPALRMIQEIRESYVNEIVGQ